MNYLTTKEEDYIPWGMANASYQGLIYMADDFCNALFSFDPQSGCFCYLGSFLGEPSRKIGMYFSAVTHKGKIYFAPAAAHYIGIYDVEKASFQAVEVPIIEGLFPKMKYKFGDIFAYEDAVYLVAAAAPYVLKLDTKNQITVINIPNPKGVSPFFRRGMQSGDHYYISDSKSSWIYHIDLKTDNVDYFDYGNTSGTWQIYADQKNLWLAPWGSGQQIRVITLQKGKPQKSCCIDGYVSEQNGAFLKFRRWEKSDDESFLYALPMSADFVLKMNLKTLEVSQCFTNVLSKDLRRGFLFENENGICIYEIDETLSPLEARPGDIRFLWFEYSKEEIVPLQWKIKNYRQFQAKMLQMKMAENQGVLKETSDFGLEEYLKTIVIL